MNKRSFDQNFVIGLLAGGFGIMVYEILKTWFKSFMNVITPEEFKVEILPIVFAGISVLLITLVYAKITLKKKQASNGV